jgi:hypothetical protein
MQEIDTIDALVHDWLVRQGHGNTYAKLPLASSKRSNDSLLAVRSEIVKSIMEGRILEALDLIKLHFKYTDNSPSSPVAIITTKDLPKGPFVTHQAVLLLKLQHFIELLRGKNTEAALYWVRTELTAEESNVKLYSAVLQETLGVLAYENGEKSPLAWLFNQKLRFPWLASITNSALFNSTTTTTTTTNTNTNILNSFSPIEIVMKHCLALDDLIHQINGFENDLDNKKWAALASLLTTTPSTAGTFVKLIKND